MDGNELLRKLRRLARRKGVRFDFVARPGKGGHAVIIFRNTVTSLRPPRHKEIPSGTLRAMPAQPGMLRGYMKLGQPIPPAGPSHGRRTIALPSLIAAKVALYSAMRDRGVSIIEMARRLGIAESTMKRILDLDRRSHIGDIEAALATMGLRLEVIAREAA